jgi:hypothetical protein
MQLHIVFPGELTPLYLGRTKHSANLKVSALVYILVLMLTGMWQMCTWFKKFKYCKCTCINSASLGAGYPLPALAVVSP